MYAEATVKSCDTDTQTSGKTQPQKKKEKERGKKKLFTGCSLDPTQTLEGWASQRCPAEARGEGPVPVWLIYWGSSLLASFH